MNSTPALAIVGPTASGKSDLALRIAGILGGEIVSCDAFQVYRFMTIGTAKPSSAERHAIPHHMLDLLAPSEPFSAGEYQRLAREALRSIRDREKVPIVAGGSGLYMKALIEGFFQGPGRSEELRKRMRRIAERRGAGSLYRALERVDPEGARKIAPGDISRIIRFYEIFLLTGKTMIFWQAQPRDPLRGFRWLKIGIAWSREILYERINRRVDEMIGMGFCDEVRSLIHSFPETDHAFKAIGYRQLAEHLEGRCGLKEATEDIKRESRRYAKRQLTWFRADPDIQWLDGSDEPGKLTEQALRLWNRFAAGAN